MSEETVINVNLKFIVKETGMFPPYEGKCQIACTGADGKEWKGAISYNDGRNVEDAIKTICRMDSFRATLPQLAVAASAISQAKAIGGMEPEPAVPAKPKAKPTPAAETDHYSVMRAELMKNKIGQLRKIISDQNLDLTTGGKKKEKVVEEIISRLKSRDGIKEETLDEEA